MYDEGSMDHVDTCRLMDWALLSEGCGNAQIILLEGRIQVLQGCSQWDCALVSGWLYQLCSSMIFNHDPPICTDCMDCGGLSHCGIGCSALVSKNIRGYPVCTTIARSSSRISLIDKEKPHMGVVVQMSNTNPKLNCSLAVSVICDSSGVQEPQALEVVGPCHYATVLKHPSGCARIAIHGKGLGWFGTFLIIILCLFGGYLVAGIVYRHFFLRISGIDVIPNLEFWASLPHRIQSMFISLMRRFRGPSQGYRSSYSPVNF